MTEANKPTPTRPNSKWASGRRREVDGPRELVGFYQGARVAKATPKANPKRRSKYRRK